MNNSPNSKILKLLGDIFFQLDKYNGNAWDDDETNDEQWPYRVKFSGTDLLGNFL